MMLLCGKSRWVIYLRPRLTAEDCGTYVLESNSAQHSPSLASKPLTHLRARDLTSTPHQPGAQKKDLIRTPTRIGEKEAQARTRNEKRPRIRILLARKRKAIVSSEIASVISRAWLHR